MRGRRVAFLVLLTVSATLAQPRRLTPEGRGLWVPAWELSGPGAVERVVETAVAHGFNELFLQVRYRGDALYQPNRHDTTFPNPEPRSAYLARAPAGYDPLEHALELCRASGLRLHAWVVCFEITGGRVPASPAHVVNRHPEWLAYGRDGRPMAVGHRAWLDPGVAAVRDYTADVLGDLAANYAVDGLHLDYVRYESPRTGFNPLALEEFTRETGFTSPSAAPAVWADWRREQITRFVAAVARRLGELRPEMLLSAAVYAERDTTARDEVSQDWGRWLRAGYLDLLVTMSYFTDEAMIARQLERAVECADGSLVYAGLLLRELHDERRFIPPGELRVYYDAVRLRGADGMALFSYSDLREYQAVGLEPGELFDGAAAAPLPAASAGQFGSITPGAD